ncbi:SH3 domain-containing protein [Pseudooceanicola sp.]|uniref:SH3 domain-containing protein n=1 Tax=Pseudooceanicola sp. TaxID=1914328 RepID=UPI0035C7899E
MTRPIALLAAGLIALATPALAADRHEVYGVAEDDMLKMRAGPGTGYDVIVGLPNGAEVLVRDCERTGSTVWCRVSLRQARGLKGYVSKAYIREK